MINQPALFCLGQALALQPVADVLRHGVPGKQCVFLKHDRAFPSGFRDDLSADTKLAARGLLEAGEQVQQCRLSASARSDDREELVLLDLERHVHQTRAAARP